LVFQVVRKLGGPIPQNIEQELLRQGFDSFHALTRLGDEKNLNLFLAEAKNFLSEPFNLGHKLALESIAALLKCHSLESLSTMAGNIKKFSTSAPRSAPCKNQNLAPITIEDIVPPKMDILKQLLSTKMNEITGRNDYMPSDFAVSQTDSPLLYSIQCVMCPKCLFSNLIFL